MNRRQYISVLGTAGVGAVALFVAYQADQGNIDIGDEAAVSGSVSRETESFEFEAADGDEIFITVRDAEETRRERGSLALSDPDGTVVVETGLRMGETNETHTAERTGTYRLRVASRHERVRVSVSVTESDE